MPIQPPGKEAEEMEAEGDSAAEMNGEADESEEERSGSQTESEEESSGEPLQCVTHMCTQEQQPLHRSSTNRPLPQRWTTRTMSGAAVSVSVRCWTWKSSSQS